MRIYLAGPMRGIPQLNFPAFHLAAAKLRAEGHEVFNPAEEDEKVHGPNGERCNFTSRDALKRDFAWLCDHAEGIAFLPGWDDSRGAVAEFFVARALGLEFTFLGDDS